MRFVVNYERQVAGLLSSMGERVASNRRVLVGLANNSYSSRITRAELHYENGKAKRAKRVGTFCNQERVLFRAVLCSAHSFLQDLFQKIEKHVNGIEKLLLEGLPELVCLVAVLELNLVRSRWSIRSSRTECRLNVKLA